MTSLFCEKASLKMSSFVELSPFVDDGGLGKMWKVFGQNAEVLINELNTELAA